VCNTGAIETITQTGAVTCLTAGDGLGFSAGQFVVDYGTTQHAIAPCATGSLLNKADSTGAATCYSPGTGLEYNAATSAWRVDANTIQKRVTGTCASGAITSIAQDGTVTCGGVAPAFTTVAATVMTNSTSYASLGGGSPSVTATIGASGSALVTITAAITPTNGNLAYIGVSVDNGNASDTQALVSDTNFLQASASYVITGLSAGNHTFAARYKVSGGGMASFANRSIIVTPM
jgi:hypothetical protein